MVNSSLYTWSETILFSGSNSCSRMTIAMIPAMRKNPNEVIRYMYPMTLWSVDDSQPARTVPFRSVRRPGMIGVPVTGGCWSMVLTWYHSCCGLSPRLPLRQRSAAVPYYHGLLVKTGCGQTNGRTAHPKDCDCACGAASGDENGGAHVAR